MIWFSFKLKQGWNGCEAIRGCEMNKNIVESIANAFPCAWFWFSLNFVPQTHMCVHAKWKPACKPEWSGWKNQLNRSFYQCDLHLTNHKLTAYTLFPQSFLRCCLFSFRCVCAIVAVDCVRQHSCTQGRMGGRVQNWQQRMLSRLLFTIYYVLKSKHTG